MTANLREAAEPAVIAGTFSDYRLVKSRSRFQEFCEPVPHAGCWIWMGSNRSDRYGAFRLNGKPIYAHRASWLLYRGAIPAGLNVLHKCDIGWCVNPDHLFLGTPLDNAKDRELKGRGNQPKGERNGRHTKPDRTCRGDAHPARRIPGFRQGAKNGRAKLTPDDVRAIRASPLGCWRLGKQYNVSKTTILGIRNRRLWGYVP